VNIITKPVAEKYDPKRPQGHPDYARAVEKGNRLYPQMKFYSEAHKRDYDRAVDANPNNVRGMPLFYTALITKTVVGIALRDCRRDGHRPSNTRNKFCTICWEDIDE